MQGTDPYCPLAALLKPVVEVAAGLALHSAFRVVVQPAAGDVEAESSRNHRESG
jgi:hypothetical protein